MRIITLNVNGIRSAGRKGMFDWLEDTGDRRRVSAGDQGQIDQTRRDELYPPRGFHRYYYDAEQKGYSGVAIYAKRKPDRVVSGLARSEFDREGRYLEAQFGRLSVVSAVPAVRVLE